MIGLKEHYNLYYILEKDKKRLELPPEKLKIQLDKLNAEYLRLQKFSRLLTKNDESFILKKHNH